MLRAGTILAAINEKCSMLLPSQPQRSVCSHRWCMVENEKHSHQKDVSNYPDGCIICLKSFPVGCVSAVKKVTQIVKIEGDKNDKEIVKCMVCLLQVMFILWSNLISHFVFLCCTSHCILSESRGQIPINLSKLSCCSLNTNFYFTDITCSPFISLKQQDPFSKLQL